MFHLVIPSRPQKNSPGVRHNITKGMAASAGAQNVTAIHPDVEKIARFVVEYICSSGWYLNRRTRRLILAGKKRRCNRPHVVDPLIPEGIDGTNLSHAALVRSLASPRGHEGVIAHVQDDLLKFQLPVHARALDRARKEQPTVYRAVIGGKFILARSKILDPCCSQQRWLTSLVAMHECLLLVRSAHKKIQDIRDVALGPIGARARLSTWATVGPTFLLTVASPASLVRDSYELAKSTGAGDLTDDAVVKLMIKRKLLPKTLDGTKVIQIAKLVRDILLQRQIPDRIAVEALEGAFDAVEGIAELDSADMRAAGLARASFTELRFGLSPSEAASYVAVELLRALDRVSAKQAMILASQTAELDDTFVVTAPSNRRAMLCAAVLRLEGQPDMMAATLGASAWGEGELDSSNNTNLKPVQTLKQKLENPAIAAKAKAFLGIAPRSDQ